MVYIVCIQLWLTLSFLLLCYSFVVLECRIFGIFQQNKYNIIQYPSAECYYMTIISYTLFAQDKCHVD